MIVKLIASELNLKLSSLSPLSSTFSIQFKDSTINYFLLQNLPAGLKPLTCLQSRLIEEILQ